MGQSYYGESRTGCIDSEPSVGTYQQAGKQLKAGRGKQVRTREILVTVETKTSIQKRKY